MHGGRWHVAPDQEINVENDMRKYLKLDVGQGILEGALAYRIQRKHAESIQYKSKHIWLLVAWRFKYTKEPHVRALLVEHNKRLDENRLRKLYQKYWPSLKKQINATRREWTLDDTTMLVTRISVEYEDYIWNIYIEEKNRTNFTMISR
jgi:hypothetical protein